MIPIRPVQPILRQLVSIVLIRGNIDEEFGSVYQPVSCPDRNLLYSCYDLFYSLTTTPPDIDVVIWGTYDDTVIDQLKNDMNIQVIHVYYPIT